MNYTDFLKSKVKLAQSSGFEVRDEEINPKLKPHQRAIVRWMVQGGRRACFAAFGLGKSCIQLEAIRLVLAKLAEQGKPARGLIVIPLGVRQEFRRDAVELLGWEDPPRFIRSIDEAGADGIYLTNYETVRDGKLDPRLFDAASLDEASCLRGFGGSKTFREFMALFAGDDRRKMGERTVGEGIPFRFVGTATPSPNEYIELHLQTVRAGARSLRTRRGRRLLCRSGRGVIRADEDPGTHPALRRMKRLDFPNFAELPLSLPETQPPTITEKSMFHVGVSGGKDSSAALIWLVNESGIPREKIRASFCNIGNDHEWTIDHVRMLSENVHPIETIYPERDFFTLAFEKRRFPSTKARFCTEHLKIHPTQDHIQRLRYQGFSVIAVSGVRADESDDRSDLPEWDYSGTLLCYQWRPLIRWTIDDVFAIHAKYGIPLNPLYAEGAERVGCWPCIMSRKAEIRTIALKFPKRIDEIRKAENQFETAYGRYSSFFAADTVPERFRSKPFKLEDGSTINVCTIDDVVRWSMTGDRARGSYLDQPKREKITCNSGFCE